MWKVFHYHCQSLSLQYCQSLCLWHCHIVQCCQVGCFVGVGGIWKCCLWLWHGWNMEENIKLILTIKQLVIAMQWSLSPTYPEFFSLVLSESFYYLVWPEYFFLVSMGSFSLAWLCSVVLPGWLLCWCWWHPKVLLVIMASGKWKKIEIENW